MKTVFTWFWIRSSLPKKIWEKCMDYQVKTDSGKLTSYKLVGHSVVPTEVNIFTELMILMRVARQIILILSNKQELKIKSFQISII